MMDDLISRQAVIQALKGNVVEIGGEEYSGMGVCEEEIESIVNDIPSEEKTAEWIVKDGIVGVAYCSKCDYELHTDNTNYCPNCGSRMKGENQ